MTISNRINIFFTYNFVKQVISNQINCFFIKINQNFCSTQEINLCDSYRCRYNFLSLSLTFLYNNVSIISENKQSIYYLICLLHLQA